VSEVVLDLLIRRKRGDRNQRSHVVPHNLLLGAFSLSLLGLARSWLRLRPHVPHQEEFTEEEHETTVENQAKHRVEPVHMLAGQTREHRCHSEEHLGDLHREERKNCETQT
jgi:hypothetical protein